MKAQRPALIQYVTPDGATAYHTPAAGAHVPRVGDTVCLPDCPDGPWTVASIEAYPGTGDVIVQLDERRTRQVHYVSAIAHDPRTVRVMRGATVPRVGETVSIAGGNASPDASYAVLSVEHHLDSNAVEVQLGAHEPSDAESILHEIHDVLYPPSDPDRSWDPDTIETVAGLVVDAVTGRRRAAALVDGAAALVDGLAEALQEADDTDDAPKSLVDRLDSAFAELTHLYDSAGMADERAHFERLLGALRAHMDTPRRWLSVRVMRHRVHPTYSDVAAIDARYHNELAQDALEVAPSGAMRFSGASHARITRALDSWHAERSDKLRKAGVSDADISRLWRFDGQWMAEAAPAKPAASRNETAQAWANVNTRLRTQLADLAREMAGAGVLAVARPEHGSAILFEHGTAYRSVMRSLVGLDVRTMSATGTTVGHVCRVKDDHEVWIAPVDADGQLTGEPCAKVDPTRTTFYVL